MPTFIAFMVITCGIASIWIITKHNYVKTNENLVTKIKEIMSPLKFLRIWLCAFFVLGMYMFQSTFASSMKDVLARVGISAVLVAEIGGFRSYALRFFVSAPVAKWSDKWKSIVLGLVSFLALGFIAAIIFTTLPGYNGWFLNLSNGLQIFLQIILVILFLFIEIIGWILLTLRFVQVGELPMEKNQYTNTISLVTALFKKQLLLMEKNFNKSLY